MLLVFFSIFVQACGNSLDLSISLPESPELFGTPAWAVVNIQYARLYESSDRDSKVLAVLRRGQLLSLEQRYAGSESKPSQKGLWYFVTLDPEGDLPSAWIEGDALRLFSRELRAREEARRLILQGMR